MEDEELRFGDVASIYYDLQAQLKHGSLYK